MMYSVATHAIRNMLDRNKYEVPRYQRGYAWSDTQVDEFWEDLEHIMSVNKDRHFFGTIYTDGLDKILDGQQRTTTVFLFLLAAKNYLKTKDAKDDMINRLDKYLLNGTKPKLTLSKINDEYFQELVNDSPNVKRPPSDFENDSNYNMHKAYRKLHEKVTQYGNNKGLNTVKRLIEKLLYDFLVIQVTVMNSSDAYSMFHLVNNRGIPLNQYDLIRNHIFAELEQLDVDDQQIENVDKKWSQIAKNIRKSTNYNIDVFIQHILSFKRDDVSVKNIFKELKEEVKPGEMLKWVADANDWSTIVKTLRKPNGNFCDHAGRSYDSERHIKRINDLGAVAVYPLLMVGFTKYWKKEDYASFNLLSEVCLKYHLVAKTIGNASVSEYQSGLFKIAQDCYKKDCDVNEIIDALCATHSYISDEDLELMLKAYKPRSRPALILLELIEAERSDTISHNTVTVEHIMPKTIGKWLKYICEIHDHCPDEYAKIIHQNYFNRLGNLTLLNTASNSRLGDNYFTVKLKTYGKSNYQVTKEIASEEQWGKAQIERRQQKFVMELKKILDIKSLKTK